MRRFLTLLLCIGTLTTVGLTAVSVNAHELLPKQLLEFTEANPNATEAEINAFLNQNPEVFKNDIAYRTKLLETIRTTTAGGSTFQVAYDFFVLGIVHILEGTDHILFVLTIFLVFTTLSKVLKSITAFTLAHSITLILAGTGIVVLSPSIVEPIIAFSIAYMAITTVFFGHIPFFRDHGKIGVIFLFGLFHGLGFAGLLEELGIPSGQFLTSLISFNVGIELGQLVILAIALPLIYLFRNKAWYPIAVRVVAVLISLMAVYWMIERLFF